MHATPDGTARYADSFPELRDAGFYRNAAGLCVSSLGIGTYLGAADEPADLAYTLAVTEACRNGVNFIDTALNYRHQRSERAVGAALWGLERQRLVVCSKAGFLTPGAVPGFLEPQDVVGGMHSMAPLFLADQLERSRSNLGVDTVDVFYLHNPETQLGFRPRAEFDEAIRQAFERLERLAEKGKIQYYGVATWDGLRKKDALSLPRLAAIAAEVGGPNHRFRFVQLPFNMAMVEAYVDRPESVLACAARLGIAVVASATLLQGQAAAGLPQEIAETLPGFETDAQRAIQFTRSAPGIAVALVGMGRREHVIENLGVGRVPPLAPAQFERFFR